MVLFIENKKSFEEDLGDKSSKEIHKQIYSNLRYYLNTKNGVPSKLFGHRGREIHFFILRRCNIDDNFFVYSYGGYDMEVN